MEMTNNAALGYAIAAAKASGIEDSLIQELVDNMRVVFDFKTESEASAIYEKSPY